MENNSINLNNSSPFFFYPKNPQKKKTIPKAMKNQISFTEEDQTSESSYSHSHWWRTAEEFKDQNGVAVDFLVDFSNLKPKFKVLREMERLAMIASEGLDDVRHKLISYRSGDFWLPIGGIEKGEMDIPHVITVLLVGVSGSGKSSLVNLMYSVLGRSGLIPFSQTSSDASNYTTMYLEEHNVLRSMRSGFCVYDTRGLDYNRMGDGVEEVSGWIRDGVRHNQPCYRIGDRNIGSTIPFSSTRFAKRKVNCVMVVANLAEISKAFKCGDLKPIEATKELFSCPSIRKSNENPILILTHGDLLSTEDRINGRLKVCEYLGISETTGAYDIPCLTEQGILPEESDPVTSYALTEAIYRILMQADRTHLPKRKFKDRIMLVISWIMCSIAVFFGMLAHFFSRLGQKHKLKM